MVVTLISLSFHYNLLKHNIKNNSSCGEIFFLLPDSVD
jgi:hypothetical protein